MKFIDTHVHLQDYPSHYIDEKIKFALKDNIEFFLCVSSKLGDFEIIENLATKYPSNIIPCFGFHPWYLEEIDFAVLEEFILRNPKALIGEIGIDGYRENKSKQIEVFVAQVEIAKKYRRPISIHSVKAQSFFETNWNIMPEKFVFHSYNGRKDFAKKIVDNGGYISFSSMILKNKDLKDIYKTIPENRILIETDAPYQLEELISIKDLGLKLADILEEDREKFMNRLYENSMEFMKIE